MAHLLSLRHVYPRLHTGSKVHGEPTSLRPEATLGGVQLYAGRLVLLHIHGGMVVVYYTVELGIMSIVPYREVFLISEVKKD